MPDITRYVSHITGLTPNQKLLLWELASFRSQSTGQCNPGVDTLAKRTGLARNNVQCVLKELTKKGLIARGPDGWLFPDFHSEPAEAVPDDFWPSDAAVEAIVASYPHHHFNLEEAVHDFIAFCHRRKIAIPADQLDSAFTRNIDTLLARREPGEVSISVDGERDKPRSVLSLLAGLRHTTD